MPAARTKSTAAAVHAAQCYFSMLGVHKGSTPQEIGEARKGLAQVLHPDRGGDASAMAAVNQAHAVLTDKALRARHLAALATGRVPCPTCKGAGAIKKQRGFTQVTYSPCTLCGGSGLLIKGKTK